MTQNQQHPTREPQLQGFLSADDIGYGHEGGNVISATIERIAEPGTVKDATGKVVDREVVYFKKATKALVLNSTNTRILRLTYGRDKAEWIGKPIQLTVRFVNAFGERDIPTIRVMPPDGVPLPFGVRKWAGRGTPATTENVFKLKGK